MVVRMFVRGRSAVSTGIPGLCAALLLAGCSATHTPASQPKVHASSSQSAATQPVRSAALDPMRLLQDACARCDALDGYQIVFHRQERRGLLAARLCDWEDLKVSFRKQPTSIKMAWLNPDSEYVEAVYIDGANDGKVTVLARKGFFGLPAAPVSVPPEMAVTMGKSLRPITDFGLAAMLRRTLSHVEQAAQSGGATVTYEGQTTVEKLGTRAHHIVVRYPEGFTRAAKQDIYISVDTGFPAGTFLWLPNGDLFAAYLYEKPVVIIPADEVFALVKKKTLARKD